MSITIETESAGAFADANEADLQRIVMAMSEANSYVIIHRQMGDGYDWAQAALKRTKQRKLAGGYIVEHQLPTGRLEQTTVDSAERVYVLLAGWAFGRPGWQAGERWKPLAELQIDFIGNCAWEEREGEVHGYFEPLDIGVRAKDRATAEGVMREALRLITNADKDKARVFSEWASQHLIEVPKSAVAPADQ